MQSSGEPGIGPGQFNPPHGIWVAPDGRVLVTDRENGGVKICNPDGEVLDQWREGPSATVANQISISAAHDQAYIA